MEDEERGQLVLLAAVVAATVALVPVASVQSAPTHTQALPKTIQVATGFRPDVLFTPFYVAQDLGYYKKAGLDVQMNYDRVSNLMQLVGRASTRSPRPEATPR